MFFWTLVACGDTTSANGEFGNLEYSIFTQYEMGTAQLTEVGILTGHMQEISAVLTDSGSKKTDTPQEILHALLSESGAETGVVESYNDAVDEAPAVFHVTVDIPGSYVLTSSLNGSVFDQITLQFAEPVALDHATWLRGPNEEDFEKASSDTTLTVIEGTEAAFLEIPTGTSGDRLVGVMEPVVTVEPAWAAVAGSSVVEVYEDEILGKKQARSLYFIEPGTVTVTITDPVSGAVATQSFEVTAEETGG